ncbi:MAG TPA: aminoacyl--tRNA ligase-related protein, partial [Candidatus Nanoarchaeia archaeon]|nr:aminoacyl--tRNA ligase-related protein [Candidatus Nanoarchaeia archaeon]
MLDIKLLRENPDIVRKDLKKRGDAEKLRLVDEIIDLDARWRQVKYDFQTTVHRKNDISKEIAGLKKQGKDFSLLLKELERIPETIDVFTSELEVMERKIKNYLMNMPNILHESVPAGKDDSQNVVVRQWGVPQQSSFQLKSHVDLLASLDLADIESAANVSGARFYYLKNELVLLDMALQKFALDFLHSKGFTLIYPPPMMRRAPYEGVTSLGDFEDVMYKIEGEDLYLIATSEHPMAAMFMDKTLPEDKLPMNFAGVSSCYRKEAGA